MGVVDARNQHALVSGRGKLRACEVQRAARARIEAQRTNAIPPTRERRRDSCSSECNEPAGGVTERDCRTDEGTPFDRQADTPSNSPTVFLLGFELAGGFFPYPATNSPEGVFSFYQ